MTSTRAARIMTALAVGAAVAGGGAAFATAASSVPEVSDAPIVSALAAKPLTVTHSVKPHPMAQVTHLDECLPDNAVQAPRSLSVACADDNARLEKLTWKGWGGASATATGIASVNDCLPDCVTGTTRTYPVAVRASQLRHRESTQAYTSITVTYTGAVPGGEDRTSTYGLPR